MEHKDESFTLKGVQPVHNRAHGGRGWSGAMFNFSAHNSLFVLVCFGRARKKNQELFKGARLFFTYDSVDPQSKTCDANTGFVIIADDRVILRGDSELIDQLRSQHYLAVEDWLTEEMKKKKSGET